jgi:hypothetical protein
MTRITTRPHTRGGTANHIAITRRITGRERIIKLGPVTTPASIFQSGRSVSATA